MESEARETVVLDVKRSEKNTNDLYNAAVEGSVTILIALLRRDPLILNEVSLTPFSETPLHVASSLGHVAFARALVEKKPVLAVELDSLARSPLHLASAEGHVDVVKLLLGAAPDACMLVDRDDRIPLHLAAIRGRVEVLEELIRVCPDSTQVTLNGDSVAHLCVKYCRLEALTLLLENESGHKLLYSRDSEGNSVLHLAVMLNHFKVVKYLGSLEGIKEMANKLNHGGHTALDVFDKSQNKDFSSFRIQQVLLKIGVSRALDPTQNIPSPAPSPSFPASANVNSGDGTVDVEVEPTSLAEVNHMQKTWATLKKFAMCFRSHPDWVRETQGNLMVVATVIASMCFQAIMNPPGGVWQEDTTTGSTCTVDNVCLAGTPVLAYGDTEDQYLDFIQAAAMAFVLSLVIITLHFSGHPVSAKGVTLVVVMVIWYIIAYLSNVYVLGIGLLHPGSDFGLIIIALYIWYPMLFFFVFIHTVRTVRWLLFQSGFIRRFRPRVRKVVSAVIYVICIFFVCRTMGDYEAFLFM